MRLPVYWFWVPGLMLAMCGCKVQESHLFRVDALRVGVIPGPAEEILSSVEPELARQRVTLKIVWFPDAMQADLALNRHDVDADLCQSMGFLNQFNRDHQARFVSLGAVYVPVMAIYAGVAKGLDALADGARIAVPSDAANHDRALLLLGKAGLLQLARDAGATSMQIVANPKQLKLVGVNGAQLPQRLAEMDVAVIDGDFALGAGLNPQTGSLLRESAMVENADVLAIDTEAQLDTRARALAAALVQPRTKSFIHAHWSGAVEPAD